MSGFRMQAFLGAASLAVAPLTVLAGGGGQNMLLVVNPESETGLRVAAAYQQAHHIPDRNVIFISPPKNVYGNPQMQIADWQFTQQYAQPIAQAIRDRGLEDQIDYIGTIDQPNSFTFKNPFDNKIYTASTSYAITHLTMVDNEARGLANGLSPRETTMLSPAKTPVPTSFGSSAGNLPTFNLGSSSSLTYSSSTPGVLHHSQVYANTPYYDEVSLATRNVAAQYYTAGIISHTGVRGNSAADAIDSFERAAAADGTRPAGTVYFEENDDIRSNTREPQWSAVKLRLNSRGIPWIQESNTPGDTPQNRNNVRGVIAGKATITLPNGSTYAPGSWADHMTSEAASFNRGQTQISEWIRSGAAGSAGNVTEPFSYWEKFTHAGIHVLIADGTTLGEAYAKSVKYPVQSTMLGDMLAQPYADVPIVSISSGPADGEAISGSVQILASAALSSPALATAVQKLELYVDGKYHSTINASSGSFQLDTTTMADGQHEIRLVAVNNAAAQSQGQLLRTVAVDNRNRSVTAPANALTLGPQETGSVAVSAAAGDGAVSRIELRHMGRVIGSINGAAGNVGLDAAKLAYGENRLIPVAVYSDGTEVAGAPVVVTRDRRFIGGRVPSPVNARIAGVKAEYFLNKGTDTIAESEFAGTADIVTTHSKIDLWSGLTFDGVNRATLLNASNPEQMATSSIDGLAIRLSGKFEVTPESAGEYQFFFYRTCDAAQVLIDGQLLIGFDKGFDGTATTTHWAPSIFLGPGEHDLVMLSSNVTAGARPQWYDVSLDYRGPDGINRIVDSGFLYQVIPEPATSGLLGVAAFLLMRQRGHRRRRRG